MGSDIPEIQEGIISEIDEETTEPPLIFGAITSGIGSKIDGGRLLWGVLQ